MKRLLDFINESNDVQERIKGQFTPEDLYEHFDVDGDGVVTLGDYVAKVMFHAARPEYLNGLIEGLDIQQQEHASGKLFKEDFIQEHLEENKTELTTDNNISEAAVKTKVNMNPPTMLVMRRVSIRQFPNGQYVALYYIDKMNKYVTIPLDSTSIATAH